MNAISEVCGCGATIEIKFELVSSVNAAIEKWRAEHRHEYLDDDEDEGD